MTNDLIERMAKAIRHGDYRAFESDNFYGDAIDWPLAQHIARLALNASAIEALQARVVELERKVEIAAAIFEEYARLHLAKGTEDGNAKAKRNMEYALEMRAALSNQGEGK